VARFRETVAAVLLACAIAAIAPAAAICAEPVEPPSEEIICFGDSCQPLPPEPEDPTPGTLVPTAGNPPLHIFEPRQHGKKHRKGDRRKHRRGRDRRAERPMR